MRLSDLLFIVKFVTIIYVALSFYPLLYLSFRRYMEIPIVKRITNAESALKAFRYRRFLKVFRFFLLFIFMIVNYLLIQLFAYFVPYWRYDDVSKSIIVCSYLGIFLLPIVGWYKKLNGTISVYTKDRFIKKNQDFILYLRGFSHDDYSSVDEIRLQNHLFYFSEFYFMSCLNQLVPACAVGMTKEYDPPYGATRVYLNDNMWQNDVRELMEKAQKIFVLVESRPSCIWEIIQSSSFLDKTVFIIDDVKVYDNVREQAFYPSFLPNVSNKERFYIMFKESKAKIHSFINSINGYKEVFVQTDVMNLVRKVYEKKTSIMMTKSLYGYAGILALYIAYLFAET